MGSGPWLTSVALRRHFQRREAGSQGLVAEEEEEVAAAVAVAVAELLAEPVSLALAL